MNTPRFSRYKTVEASMNKRLGNKWSASDRRQLHLGRTTSRARRYRDATNTPNGAVRRRHDALGLQGCRAPTTRRCGIRLSPLLRHQAGANFARQISVGAAAAPPPSGAIFSGTINVEPLDSQPPGQHHRVRRARRARLQAGPHGMRAARRSSTCSTSPTATPPRRGRSTTGTATCGRRRCSRRARAHRRALLLLTLPVDRLLSGR